MLKKYQEMTEAQQGGEISTSKPHKTRADKRVELAGIKQEALITNEVVESHRIINARRGL